MTQEILNNSWRNDVARAEQAYYELFPELLETNRRKDLLLDDLSVSSLMSSARVPGVRRFPPLTYSDLPVALTTTELFGNQRNYINFIIQENNLFIFPIFKTQMTYQYYLTTHLPSIMASCII